MLEVNDLHVNIESVQVLRGFSLRLETKAMSGLVGRNGAGKTSFMRSLMGHLHPSSGSILFHGEDLTNLPPDARDRKSTRLNSSHT